MVNKDYTYRDTNKIEVIYDIISAVRTIRTSKNVPNSKKIELYLETHDQKLANFIKKNIQLFKQIHKLCFNYHQKRLDKKQAIVSVLPKVTVIVPLKTLINIEEEKQKLINDKEKVLLEIRRSENKCYKILVLL